MAATVSCPDCGSWNPPQSTRCRTCGHELRAPAISFQGPPPEAARARTAAQERAAEEQRAASAAEVMRAQRAAKRDEERKRKEYMERRDRLRTEIRAGESSSPTEHSATAAGTASPSHRGQSSGTRLPTHVRGLDDALGGGIPAGHVIVVEGAPGTMKSSLCFWIVAHNCEVDGRRALYIAAEENAGGLLQQMASLGLDLDAAAKGVKILESNLLRKTLRGEKGDWLPPLQALVTKARDAGPVDFLVLDSL